ncbi:MAG: PPC domain-containing protein [Verrucomicrobiota bacterium]
MEGARTLWTSFAARTEAVHNDGDTAEFKVTLPADAPVGIAAVRVANGKGVSSLHLMMVDDLPSVADNGTNNSAKAAQPLTLRMAVDGQCESYQMDYYKFTAKKGQRVSVEVVAQRLGSALDPFVRLLDAAGRELAFSDDAPGLGRDCRFAHTFAAAGEYVVEVRDMVYQGGAKHRYRLRLGDFPFIATPFPLAVQEGQSAEVAFVGPDADALRAVRVNAPHDATGLMLSARLPRGAGSGFTSLPLSPMKELVESEPNNTAELATEAGLPCAVSGRFDRAGDDEWIEFTARKDQKLVIDGRRLFGSPSELFLTLHNAKGDKLAETKLNNEGEGEALLAHTCKEDGVHRLRVTELARRGGAEYTWRVELKPSAGFDLTTDVDKVEAEAGGTFTLKVTADRRDYEGPIALEVRGLGEGVTVEDNVIAEKKKDTTLKVKLPATLKAGDVAAFSVIGRAKIGETDYRAPVSIAPVLKKLYPDLRNAPDALAGSLAVGVKGP